MVKVIAELTIALLLFADASTLRWRELRRNSVLPARLLLVGFPLRVRAGFEPRGLASVIFTLIAVEALEHEGGVPTSLDEIATWTVFLSVILHGVSARPWRGNMALRSPRNPLRIWIPRLQVRIYFRSSSPPGRLESEGTGVRNLMTSTLAFSTTVAKRFECLGAQLARRSTAFSSRFASRSPTVEEMT